MYATEKHLVFQVKDQFFTVNVINVSSIIQMPKVYKVPQAPNYIIGMINVEGDVIPVIDSGKKLMMGGILVEERSQALILQRFDEENDKYHKLGFLVTDIKDVVDVTPSKIRALPISKYHFDERLVEGMHKINEEFCMQISIDNFYKDEIEDLIDKE